MTQKLKVKIQSALLQMPLTSGCTTTHNCTQPVSSKQNPEMTWNIPYTSLTDQHQTLSTNCNNMRTELHRTGHITQNISGMKFNAFDDRLAQNERVARAGWNKI